MSDSKEDKTVFQPSKKRTDESVSMEGAVSPSELQGSNQGIEENPDKTVFQPPGKRAAGRASGQIDQGVEAAADNPDKTVFQARKKQSVDERIPDSGFGIQASEEAAPDKTVFQPKGKSSTEQDDKTRVMLKPESDDTTDAQFHVLANSQTFSSLTPEEQKRVALLAAKRKRERTGKENQGQSALGTPFVEGDNDATHFNTPEKNAGSIETVLANSAGREEEPAPLPGAPEPTMDVNPDELLKGRFQLDKVLGAGGMGVVYKAKDMLKVEAQDRDPYVAIKVLGEEFKSHPEAFIALQRESRKTQRIAHPNIVNVHDFDRDRDTVFMTMEFMEGEPLDKIIGKYKGIGLPEDLAWTILEGISAALIHAHKEHIIHSDFKPGNIFVTQKGTAKVFDFGIARAVAKAEHIEESEDDKTVFDAGDLGALTPAYASLEMLEGETPDVRDDIYALGCIAYELFTGSHPYGRVHANEAKKKGIQPKRITNISKAQWKVIQSAIAFERKDRVVTVDEFWSRLVQKRKSNVMLGMVFTLLLSVVAGVGYFLYLEQSHVPGESQEEMRSEIELKLRIEEAKRNLDQWLLSPDYSDRSLDRVDGYIRSLRKLLTLPDEWLTGAELNVFKAMFSKIDEHIDSKRFDDAKSLLKESEKYTEDLAALQNKARQIEDALGQHLAKQAADAKRLEDERLAAAKKNKQRVAKAKKTEKINTEFNVAMATVDKQLACRRTINMRDLGIAVNKLRELDQKRYDKEDSRIVKSVASCLQGIGKTFPERAEEYKTLAKRIFPSSPEISNLRIVARDPCNASIAGLGARGGRALCRDKLKSFGRGPSMVVIPGQGTLKQFAIGKYEISHSDYDIYCNAVETCQSQSKSSSRSPVTNLSMSEVNAYIVWLNEVSGKTYRLPTAAEWKYAARANTNQLDPNRNCQLNSRGIQKGGSLVPVDVGTQNKWGLVGHVGNVQELVTNPDGSISALGGSFKTNMDECTVEMQVPFSGAGDEQTGLRLIRVSQ